MTAVAAVSDHEDRASIDKAMRLLASFGSQSSTGVGVSELARRAALSKSTAFRVLSSLERNGIVERVGRQYRLGARLHDLGQHVYAPDHERVRDVLIPFLAELYETTHETVHLAALHGTDVVYLAKLYGHRRVPCPSRIGGRVPAYCTGVGKALLAHSPDALELVLAGPLEARTKHTVTDVEQLSAQLRQVRRTGLAYDGEEVHLGLRCVAAPVLTPAGRPVAALSVSAAPGRLDLSRVEPALRRAAAAAGRALVQDASARRVRTA